MSQEPITRLEKIISGEEIKPITRAEKILSGEDLKPITRFEYFLKKYKGGTSGGGMGINVQPITITENGTYTAPEGVAYSPLHVSVESSGGGGGTEPTPSGENKLAKVVERTVTEITAEDLQGCTKIGAYAFYSCKSLVSIVIPSGVTSIGDYAFDECRALASVSIPDSVTTISQYAFHYCLALTSITLPNSITMIRSNAFRECQYLENVTLPNSITRIQDYTFSRCTKLKNITIPATVSVIAVYAFQNCISMEYYDFTSHTSVPTLENKNVFTGIPSTCEIRVPMALVDEWKAATNWSTYASNIVGV